MKIYIPTDIGWYVAAMALFAPIVLIAVIEPDWVGRLSSLILWFVCAPLFPLWFALNPKAKILRDDSWLYKRFRRERVDLVNRIVALLIGVTWVWILTVPTFKDLISVVNDSAPLTRVGFVARTSQGRGLISESIVLDDNIGTDANSFSALFFPPRHIMQGNTYEFLYLPNTRIILEAHRIPYIATTTSQVLP